MIIFYFTSTGNSLSVAKRIGGNLISIPQVIDSQNMEFKDDAIGLVFPTYSFAAPGLVSRFLEKATLDAPYIFAVATYGNMPGAVLLNLRKLAVKRGFPFDYTAQLLMVDNFLPLFEIGAQIAALPKKRIEELTAQIIADIQSRTRRHASTPLWAPAITAAMRLLDGMYNGKQAKDYIINDDCTRCGVCTRVCPTGNIVLAGNIQFKDRCMACLACVHQCPHNALHLKNERSARRWRNPEVSLKEIMDANNQGN